MPSTSMFQKEIELKTVTSDTQTLFASCPQGASEFLLKEIEKYDPKVLNILPNGVEFESQPQNTVDFLLTTRITGNLWLKLREFSFNSENEFYKKIQSFPWFKKLPSNFTFKCETLFNLQGNEMPFLKSPVYVSQVAKDAIVDQYRENKVERPDIELHDPDYKLRLFIQYKNGSFVTKLYIALSKKPLSNRGYRKTAAQAPLRENLAAAIVDHIAPKYDETVIDGMTGSGTFLFEAYLYKNNLPGSYLKLAQPQKHFPLFTSCHFFTSAIRRKFGEKLVALQNLKASKSELLGLDISTQRILQTQSDSDESFPDPKIQFKNADVLKMKPPKGKKVFFANLPFGRRLGEEQELGKLYHEIGEKLKNDYKETRAYLFTANMDLRKSISLRTSERTPFFHSNLECRLFRYDIY